VRYQNAIFSLAPLNHPDTESMMVHEYA
jgi:hypothetical protein